MTEQQQTLVINPEGTTADVEYYDDSAMHDSAYYEFTVFIKFRDPALNPPDSFNDHGWEAGRFTLHYSKARAEAPELAMETARRYYDFLMAFRTSYGKEDRVNEWRHKYEDEHKEMLRQKQFCDKFSELAQQRLGRIKELETDYIKKLEGEIRAYKMVVKMARERALKDAELLLIEPGTNES